MSDLFDESGSDGEAEETDPIPKLSNGEEEPPPELENPEEELVVENGVSNDENGKEDELDGGSKEEERASQEDEEEEDKANVHTSPRDDIRLTVVQYQKAADDFAFEVLVSTHFHSN